MKHPRKSQSKSSEAVATVAPPEPTAAKDVWTEALTRSANVIDLAVLELGESTEFSRSCWIAAIRDFAAESRPMPAPNEAAAPEAASPWPQAPAVSPAEQVDIFELQRQMLELESQAPQIPCDSTACTSNLDDLEVLQQDRDQLAVQLKSQQESSAQAAHEAAEVKNRLDGLTAEFEIISAEAAQLRSDHDG